MLMMRLLMQSMVQPFRKVVEEKTCDDKKLDHLDLL